MIRKLKENNCILFYKNTTNNLVSCEGESVYTPFCTKHLSEVFGLRLKYIYSIHVDKLVLRGPYLDTDYGRKHKQNDVILFKRDVLLKELDFADLTCNNFESFSCNKTTKQYIDKVKQDNKVDESIYQYQISVLLNFLEPVDKTFKTLHYVSNSIANEAKMKITHFSNYVKDQIWYKEILQNSCSSQINMELLTPIEILFIFRCVCFVQTHASVSKIQSHYTYSSVSYLPKVGFYVIEDKIENNNCIVIDIHQIISRIIDSQRTIRINVKNDFINQKRKKTMKYSNKILHSNKENYQIGSYKY